MKTDYESRLDQLQEALAAEKGRAERERDRLRAAAAVDAVAHRAELQARARPGRSRHILRNRMTA